MSDETPRTILTPGLKAELDRRVAAKTIDRLRMNYADSQTALSDCLTEHRELVERVEALCAEAENLRELYPEVLVSDLRAALAGTATNEPRPEFKDRMIRKLEGDPT